MGEKPKLTVESVWEAGKGFTQKIKESVVGKSESVDDYVKYHVGKKKGMDEDDVVESRRKVENLDREKKMA